MDKRLLTRSFQVSISLTSIKQRDNGYFNDYISNWTYKFKIAAPEDVSLNTTSIADLLKEFESQEFNSSGLEFLFILFVLLFPSVVKEDLVGSQGVMFPSVVKEDLVGIQGVVVMREHGRFLQSERRQNQTSRFVNATTCLVTIQVERQLDLSSVAARLRGSLVWFVRVKESMRVLVPLLVRDRTVVESDLRH
ncbi:hypothetical protein Taro_002569 [Colocasia esculenta]|uniref:Uncharacterized protein n=1 Tax=Colocasia esculenta TaxID=4460 RepID=A0A843TL58_COLES|nr:hypothetical protein [Colocasia esculenta]